jgi:hypothetical protein
MPSVSVNLAKSQIDDLVAMCGLGATVLNQMAEVLEQTKPTIRRAQLVNLLSNAGAKELALEAAVRALPGLAIAVRRFNLTPRDLLDSVRLGLDKVSKEVSQQWHECGPIIERMVASRSIVLYAKARDLAFDFERMYARSRILTDIRPVYDDARNMIVAADVIQTLRLDYIDSGGETSTITIAMDTPDLEQLKKCCEDSLQKVEIARKLMESAGYEVVLPGEGAEP